MSGREHRLRSFDPRASIAVLGMALACAGCAREGVRPVITVGPQAIRYEITRADSSDEPEVLAPASPHSLADLDFVLPGSGPQSAGGAAEALVGGGSRNLGSLAGPIDLGYPLLVDLGAGDAPYDDGILPLLAEERKRGGFSDSVVRVTWRERVAPNLSVLGSAAIMREQDLSIIDSLPDARFGFAVVGLELRW